MVYVSQIIMLYTWNLVLDVNYTSIKLEEKKKNRNEAPLHKNVNVLNTTEWYT